MEQAIHSLQQRIDQLQANLTQQNKLATLGMITAVLAHEFNNILTPMISYTRYALSDKADEALRAKALAKALSGGERLANISKSLLGFARGGDESQTAPVLHCIRETLVCLSRDLAKDGIALSIDVPETLAVAMNAGQLQQVLLNLVVNARAAMVEESSAARRQSASGSRQTKRLRITAAVKHGKIAEISISDSGPGIEATVLERIFDPLFSTKRETPRPARADPGDEPLPRGGTGLGLTICQELIQSAGGVIRALSEKGNGATFIIELPIASITTVA